jgi:PAS domain S-box-containing protein
LSGAWGTASRIALLAAVYFAAARLALQFAIQPGYAAAIWPASGIAVAALLVFGARLWPAIWLGSFVANLSVEGAWLDAAVIASGSSVQAVVLAALIRSTIGVPHRFRMVRHVVLFVTLSALGATISASVALPVLSYGRALDGVELLRNWWTWWQGDATGIILVTPLLLTWAPAGPRIGWTRRKALEAAVLAVLLLSAAQLVFDQGVGESAPHATTFLIVPFIAWAALRFGQRGVTAAALAVCAVALHYTLRQAGPFAASAPNETLLLLLLFVSTVVFTGLVLAALTSQLEEALSERTEHLTESERRFRLMVESVVDYAIFMLDRDGRVASWNAGAQRILGYGADEALGAELTRFYPDEVAARGKPRVELDTARSEGRFEEEGWRRRKDGSTFWANVVVTAVRDDGGELIGFAKVIRDLTERNRVEAELIRAKVSAERASQTKSQFLANMSHELRTPLNSLLILARLLMDNPGGTLSPKQVQFAQTIYASGMDLLSLINDLLDLAKIEAGALTSVNIAPVSMGELRHDLERTFRQVAAERRLAFSIVAAPELPAVLRTDAARLKQVLKNLLANAFKFTREGGVQLRIAPARSGWSKGHAALDSAPAVIAFAVSDTGIGIAPDKQQVIFEAFQQADGSTSRQYGGTGLGLSISRELTRLLGGEITLASEPGKGSTFTLYLPAHDQRATLAA